MIAPSAPSDHRIQEEFQAFLPDLSKRFRRWFRPFGTEKADEWTAEAVAQAWAIFRSARRKGRIVTMGNLTFYITRAVLAGRRMGCTSGQDVFSESPQARQVVGRVLGLDESDPQARRDGRRPDKGARLSELLVDRHWRWPVLEYVWPQLDWTDFQRALPREDRRLLELKVSGTPQKAIADGLGVTPARVCQRLAALRDQWQARSALAEAMPAQ